MEGKIPEWQVHECPVADRLLDVRYLNFLLSEFDTKVLFIH